jgi:hypothetical protein
MVHHLFSRRAADSKPEFPPRSALPHCTDREAHAALDLLRLLVEQGRATVYLQAYTSPPQWLVWLELDEPPYGTLPQRLETWAIGVLFPDTRPSGGES